MEKHTLILLGGNNSTSKAWIQKMNQHLQLDYPTVEFFYSHWEGDSHDIDFKHEIKKLSQFIKDNKLGNYSIVAKSAGFVLSLQGIIDNLLTPKTIVGYGLPVEYSTYRGIDLEYLIKQASKKANILCIQADEDPQGKLQFVENLILDKIPIWDIKDHTHNYDNFKQMACIAKSFIATHQPQIEHTIEKIDVASISDAIQIVHRFPNKYRFKNNWIFDVEKRIYIFLYNNRKMILKQGKINKLKKEMNITEKVSQLMGKIKIGEKETIVVVPELHQINSTEGYLVSEYLGPDCNELFYQNANLNITTSDLVLLFTELNRLSIFHKGLLPRNTIIKNNKIYLIDWESAILDRNIKNELLQYKTSLLVGWRYFSQITDKDIEISLLDWKNEQQKIKHLTTYEYTFKNMLGLENMDNYHIQRLCYENIINATSYTNYISLVKLDDILHAISGIIPIEIEVLIDFLLCEEMNQDSLYLYSNLSNIVKLARMKSFMEVNEKQTKSFICNQIKRLILSKLKNEYDGIGVRESIKKVIQNRYPEFNPLDGYLTIVEKFLLI